MQTLSARLWHEVSVYGVAIRRFRYNARLYMVGLAVYTPGISVFGVLYYLYLLEIGFDETLVGQVIAAQSIGTIVGAPPSGVFYSRWGGRLSFAFSMLFIALTRLALLLSPTTVLIIVAAFFSGIANALINTSFLPFLADESDEDDRPYLFSVNSILLSFSEMAGGLLGGLMPGLFLILLTLPSFAAAQKVSMIVGIDFTLLALIPILAIGRERREQTTGAKPVAPATEQIRPRWSGFIGAGIVAFFYGLVMGASSFGTVYFKAFHHASAAQIGLFIALSKVSSIAMILIVPSLSRRWGLVKANSLLALVSAPSFFLLGLPLPLAAAVPIFLISHGAFRANWILISNLLMSVVPPQQRGTQASVRVMGTFLAMTLAGVAGGYLIVHVGYVGLFTMAALAALAGGLVTWGLFRRDPMAKPLREPT